MTIHLNDGRINVDVSYSEEECTDCITFDMPTLNQNLHVTVHSIEEQWEYDVHYDTSVISSNLFPLLGETLDGNYRLVINQYTIGLVIRDGKLTAHWIKVIH